MLERGESGRELRKIQGFSEWGRGAFDAGRFEPAWDAGMDPHARMLKLAARCVLASLRGSTYKRRDREQPGALRARGTPTMKLWSFDARSKGQPGYSRAMEIDDL